MDTCISANLYVYILSHTCISNQPTTESEAKLQPAGPLYTELNMISGKVSTCGEKASTKITYSAKRSSPTFQ